VVAGLVTSLEASEPAYAVAFVVFLLVEADAV